MTSLEIMDSMDSLTPTYGDWVDFVPLYIGGRHNGLARDRAYTEGVVGSSPIPPTVAKLRFAKGEWEKGYER